MAEARSSLTHEDVYSACYPFLPMGLKGRAISVIIANQIKDAVEHGEPAEISDNAKVVLEKRYLQRNSEGKLCETPAEMFDRVAHAIAEVDLIYGASEEEVEQTALDFDNMMSTLEFLPNSPTLMNAGTGRGTLSACFVLPLPDNMEGIMLAATNAAMVQKFGGGTGFSLSEIRGKGSAIATTHGRACGPIAVLHLLSAVSTLVTQGGKRDGANMAVMDIHHQDVMKFIDCKATEGEIHNFNISVAVTDEFMQAVKNNTSYSLRAKQTPADPDSPMIEVGQLGARETFQKIVHGAWRNGEPGMIFIDSVNKGHPARHIGPITATNPCGEQPLLPNESCNLGSIDVGKFVIETEFGPKIAWEKLGKTIERCVHFLDNVIDANEYAVEDIETMTKETRKIGLGVMGFADMLIKLGVSYDSDEGVEIGRKLMRFFKTEGETASLELGRKRGTFPGWTGSEFEKNDMPFRNACILTVAPTGTISMIAGASSGIEPLFSLVYRKQNILGSETLYYVNGEFKNQTKSKGCYSEDLMEFLSEGGSLQDRSDVPQDIKRLFRVSSDISPEYHVLMQAAFQESTDSGISKTINFPNSATPGDVERAYMLAWEEGCKGITVYRAGSREKEVLTTGHENKETAVAISEDAVATYVQPYSRPRELSGVTKRVRTGRGNVYVTVNRSKDGKPFEVFTNHGKAGGNDSAMAEALSRTISLALRSGVRPQEIIIQLKGITDAPFWDNGTMICSVPDAIAKVLEDISKKEGATEVGTIDSNQSNMFVPPSIQEVAASEFQIASVASIDRCPDCSSTLAHEEGCAKCYSCGYSKC